MVPFFVQIKCKLGQSYTVANALAEAEIASGLPDGRSFASPGPPPSVFAPSLDEKLNMKHKLGGSESVGYVR